MHACAQPGANCLITEHVFRHFSVFIYAFILEERILKSGSLVFCELSDDDSPLCVWFF